MSKGVKKALGFVAAIFIPFVAPVIAGAIASAGVAGFGGWLGSAAVGAGLGATNAALTGGDVGQGALLGGLGAGLYTGLSGTPAFAGGPTAGTAGAVGTAGTNPLVAGARDMAVKAGGTLAPATPAAPTFMEAVKQLPSTLASQFTDPTKLAELTVRAGTMLASGMMTADPMAGVPEEERQLVEMRMKELQELQRTDQEMYQRQLSLATDLMNQAKTINPQNIAQQAAKDQQLRGAAEEKRLFETYNIGFGQTGREAALNAERRRSGLDVGRSMGSAFSTGLLTGEGRRSQAIANAAGLFPTAPQGRAGDMLTTMQGYTKQSRENQKGISDTFMDWYTRSKNYKSPSREAGLNPPPTS